MAITNVGAASGNSQTTGDITLTLPTHQADDFAVLVVNEVEGGNPKPSHSINTATGWTKHRTDNGIAGTDRQTTIFYKKFTSSSETDPAVASSKEGNRCCFVRVFRGVDTTTAFDVTETFADTQDDYDAPAPAITPTTANGALLLVWNAAGGGIDSHGAPSTPSSMVGGESSFADSINQFDAYLLDYGSAATITPGVWGNSTSGGGPDSSNYSIALRPATAADTQVDVPSGNLSLTGQVPAINTGVNVAAPAGSLSLTGQVPLVATGVRIDVPAGSLSLSGHIPVIATGHTVGVPAGTFSLSGHVPVVSTGHSLTVPAGSLGLSGHVPTITAAEGTVIAVPKGALSLAGHVPSINTGVAIDTPAGTIVITGYVPIIQAGDGEEAAPVVSFPHPAWSFRTAADQIALQRKASKQVARIRKKGKKLAVVEVAEVVQEVLEAWPEMEIFEPEAKPDLAGDLSKSTKAMRQLIDDTQRLRFVYLAREMLRERENENLAILLLIA